MLQKSYLESKGGKLTLGKYPYTYARVSFMRSFLLRKDDYQRLIKMESNEIISFLQGSQYRREIDELAIRFSGMALMELALNRNLANTWAKLKRISPPNLRTLIAAYLLKVDIWNIKTIIRAKYTKLGREQLQAMLLPAGLLPEKALSEIANKDSINDVLKSIGFIDYGHFAWALEKFRETKSVSEIENALDRFYSSSMEELARRIPKEGKLFREFMEYDLGISAIITVLRLKRAGLQAKEIERLVTIPHSAKSLIRKMINSQSANDAARHLEAGRFKVVADAGIKEFAATGSLVRLELDLSRHVLKHSALLMHQHPLTVEVILGYMFAKEIEVRNLKLLLKARQLKMGSEFIGQQIISV